MESIQILSQIIIAGILGMIGQSIRMVGGLKKLNDKAKEEDRKLSDLIVTSKMLLSLLIGFSAGIIGLILNSSLNENFFTLKEHFYMVIAIGYGGTDFIESFINKQKLK